MIDIVIVNWNSGFHIYNCVNSLKLLKDINIIIVDNASTDGSDQNIANDSTIKLFKSQVNLGFASACNLGSKSGSSEFILFLNPDAAIYEDTIDSTLKFIQDSINHDVAICGVQLIDGSGNVARTCSRFPNPYRFLFHSLGLNFIFPKFGHLMCEWNHQETRDVEQVMGAFFFVRRSVFELLGGFDERFFVYYEEVDFCYRAHMAGFRTVYLSTAQAYHAGCGTSDQIRARRLFYSLRSRLLYAKKNFNVQYFIFVLLITLLIEPISRLSIAIIRGSFRTVIETFHAYCMLLQWLVSQVLKNTKIFRL